VPRVTVVTATYNYATVLPYAIASVLDQTFTDFEYLVVGDGCSDESAEVVEAVADPRVHWVNLPANVGHQSAPNNEGIGRANGELIAYLGHDDLWLPRHLELLVSAIDAGATIAHGTTLLVAPDDPPIPWPERHWAYVPGAWMPPTSVVHDRSLAVSVGGWRHPRDTGTLDAEADLWRRMAERSLPPRRVDRLTSVKLPAARRRDVYRDRPYDEQAEWLQRIRADDDSEAAFRSRYPESSQYVKSSARRLVDRVHAKVALRTRLRNAGLLAPAPAPETAEDRRLAGRAFKGLDE
jgi:glycosyltransferase involved in cell wall biosynthesis